MDVVADFTERQMDKVSFPYPYRENATKLWQIIEKYVGNYVDCYYTDEASLQKDEQLQNWYKNLEKYIPNGVSGYAKGLSIESVRKLITLFIYTASVHHTQAGCITYNYLGWFNKLPPQVRIDGKRPSIGAHQRFINALFTSNTPSPKLTDNFGSLALNEEGKSCMQEFVKDLLELQDSLKQLKEQGEEEASILFPKELPCSVAS